MTKFIKGKDYLFDLKGDKYVVGKVVGELTDALRVNKTCKIEVSDSEWIQSSHGGAPTGSQKINPPWEVIQKRNINRYVEVDSSSGNELFDYSFEQVKEFLNKNGQEVDR